VRANRPITAVRPMILRDVLVVVVVVGVVLVDYGFCC